MGKKREFEKQGGPVWFHQWDNWEEGQYVIGELVKTSQDKKYKRTNYHIKVEDFDIECTNQNDEPLKEGCILVANGCGSLEKWMADVNKGDTIKLVYGGKGEITGGDWEGEMAHGVEVHTLKDEYGESTSSDDDGEDL